MLNVLVYGSGGREHSIVKALKGSDFVKSLYAYPGSSGIFEDCERLNPESESFEDILTKIKSTSIGLVVVGPEQPLVEGLSDYLRKNDVLVFGPSQEGAKLEGDKIFAKEFMDEFKIPTAAYKKISHTESLKQAMKDSLFQSPYVFKYKGLAGGKGVLVSSDEDEVFKFSKSFQVHDNQNEDVAILEEPLKGWELSCICLVNENDYKICPILQDHKRLKDNDEGPNTGGMGVAGPLEVSETLLNQIKKEIVEPTVEGLKKRKFFYRGVIYIGIMVTKKGPKVLEYNVRFGDPEAQLIFPLVDSDWGKVLLEVGEGRNFSLNIKNKFGCCVVLSSRGYPESPIKDDKISGLDHLKAQNYCHAGTLKKEDGSFYTYGGRVLNILGFGDTLDEAQTEAYKNLKFVKFNQMQFRTDIGSKLIKSADQK